MVRERYADFGPEFAREYLASEHRFTHSTETLRGWMIQDGLWSAKRRKVARIHSPRERRACRGELVQIDGSHHDWFEGRAPKCCLIAFIQASHRPHRVVPGLMSWSLRMAALSCCTVEWCSGIAALR